MQGNFMLLRSGGQHTVNFSLVGDPNKTRIITGMKMPRRTEREE
jgi:hypothetical protein